MKSQEPKRALRADFNKDIMTHMHTAKQREHTRRQYHSFTQGEHYMSSLKYLRTLPGALATVAVIATSSVGAYAFTHNWFNGDIGVSGDASIITIDTSKCKGVMIPGADSEKTGDTTNFKILDTATKSPQTLQTELQTQILGWCEEQAVDGFYQQKLPQVFKSDSADATVHYHLLYATIQSVNSNGTVTMDYQTGAKGGHQTGTLALASDVTVYDKGQSAQLRDLKSGDHVMFAAKSNGVANEADGGVLDANTSVLSIFKTQYDQQVGKLYDATNVMPLDEYNNLHKNN